MKFGFKVPHHDTSWTAVRDVWRVGDELDVFESAWTYDHLLGLRVVDGAIQVDASRTLLDGWSLLAALAVETSRLRIGNLVTGVPFRHPAVLAKMAATIDEVSGGRLELGLGAGWMDVEASILGIELGRPAERADRFEEAVSVLCGLLAGDVVEHAGRHYRLTGACIAPVPPAGRLRVWIGGEGERRTLPLAGRWADVWNFTALRPGGERERFRAKRAVLADCCVAAGRAPDAVVGSVQLALDRSPAAFAEDVIAWGAAGAEYVVVMLPEGATPAMLVDLGAALEPLVDA